VEIDLAALTDNARVIAGLAATSLCAVVKADAYGHGAPGVAAALEAAGVIRSLAVSLVEEGVQLRDAGIRAPILVMGPAQRGGFAEMRARDLVPVVSDPGDLEELAAAGPGPIHLKVDTGMSRLGVRPDEAAAIATRASARGLAIAGVMTHLANADVDDPGEPECLTWRQLDRFAAVTAALRAAAPQALRHAANSSGTMLFPPARLDLVRVGLALYGNGAWDSDTELAAPRRQAMRFVTHIAQVRQVAPGDIVGYGALWTATRPTVCAVLPAGYADGLPRRVTGHGAAIIGGRRCPLVGAVSMDMAIADVTDVPGVAVGDEAVLLGRGRGPHGDDTITTAELAGWSGLTPYEVTCGVSKRVPRVYR
jgi:alanine racemase